MGLGKVSSSKFKYDFLPPHMPPPISPGRWSVESDEFEEFDVVDADGNVIATTDSMMTDSPRRDANVVCIALVPELIRGVYTAMRALRGAMPDNETPETIANELGELLKRCYASPH